MKNLEYLMTALLALAPALALAEEAADTSSTSAYVAAGLSVSNTATATFAQSSYLSTEFGLCQGAGCLALATGRSDNDFGGSWSLSDYWIEAKGSLAAPVGDYSAYGLLGVGNYMSTDQFFIEYGAGMSRSWEDVSIFVQASNWDGIWYVTPGVMFTPLRGSDFDAIITRVGDREGAADAPSCTPHLETTHQPIDRWMDSWGLGRALNVARSPGTRDFISILLQWYCSRILL